MTVLRIPVIHTWKCALPEVKEQDGEGAFAKRLQILQFPHAIPPEDWIRDLPARIIAERNVIMSCAIRESADFIAQPIFTDGFRRREAISAVPAQKRQLKSIFDGFRRMPAGRRYTLPGRRLSPRLSCVLRSRGTPAYKKELESVASAIWYSSSTDAGWQI